MRFRYFWVDERAVAPSDPESNYALAQTLWLAPAGVPAASIHRMPADLPDLDAAAIAYAGDLTRTLGPAARLDFVLLGVGPEGHVASLFPQHHVLTLEDRLVSGRRRCAEAAAAPAHLDDADSCRRRARRRGGVWRREGRSAAGSARGERFAAAARPSAAADQTAAGVGRSRRCELAHGLTFILLVHAPSMHDDHHHRP